MDTFPLHDALTALGDLLAADGETVRLVAVGGAALRRQGHVERTTSPEHGELVAFGWAPGQWEGGLERDTARKELDTARERDTGRERDTARELSFPMIALDSARTAPR